MFGEETAIKRLESCYQRSFDLKVYRNTNKQEQSSNLLAGGNDLGMLRIPAIITSGVVHNLFDPSNGVPGTYSFSARAIPLVHPGTLGHLGLLRSAERCRHCASDLPDCASKSLLRSSLKLSRRPRFTRTAVFEVWHKASLHDKGKLNHH